MDGGSISIKPSTCERLVRQVHTLVVRSAQVKVVFELQFQEEVEGVRQEVREKDGREQGRRELLTS